MYRRIGMLVMLATLTLAVAAPAFAAKGGRAGSTGVIYVTSQGLYYDTFGGPDVPMEGPFQKLESSPDGAYTEFGPGDVGYLGGRWWVDLNGDGQMNAGDRFFQCPLLGPGRTTP